MNTVESGKLLLPVVRKMRFHTGMPDFH